MGRMWRRNDIIKHVSESIKQAGVLLPDDVKLLLNEALHEQEKLDRDSLAYTVLKAVKENIQQAEKHALPLCQDTGMVVIFAEIGTDAIIEGDIEKILSESVKIAYKSGYFRNSVVDDPVFTRKNTGTNLPPVIHLHFVPGMLLKISGLLKGFGSENCSYLSMLSPTAGTDGIKQVVIEAVKDAGGKPCPPIIIGVGIGSTADGATVLAKQALLRKAGRSHPDSRYAELEEQILEQVNKLNIGPGGLGGVKTALAVMVEHGPTHIAGLPVAVNISCWADRKFYTEISAHEQ